jgi:hypothetical protein
LDTQDALVGCYDNANCIFLATDAECVADCQEDFVDCADDTDCDAQCITDFMSCSAAC